MKPRETLLAQLGIRHPVIQAPMRACQHQSLRQPSRIQGGWVHWEWAPATPFKPGR